MKMISSVVICGLFIGCGYESESGVELIGGSVTSIPHVVKLSPVGCTGTVIGPKTMLTAGHCYSTGQTAYFSYRGKQYAAKMTRNASYNSGPATNDHSLGVTAETMPGPYGYIDMIPVQVGEMVQLQGYGCIQNGGKDKPDGKLRAGNSTVRQIQSTEFVTRGGSALCFGDSGGSVVRLNTNSRAVIGVNSKGNITAGGNSWLARVDIQSFKTLIAKVGQKICYNASCN